MRIEKVIDEIKKGGLLDTFALLYGPDAVKQKKQRDRYLKRFEKFFGYIRPKGC